MTRIVEHRQDAAPGEEPVAEARQSGTEGFSLSAIRLRAADRLSPARTGLSERRFVKSAAGARTRAGRSARFAQGASVIPWTTRAASRPR